VKTSGAAGAVCTVTATSATASESTFGPLAASSSDDAVAWSCSAFPAYASVECVGSDGAAVYGDKTVTLRASAFCEGLTTLLLAVGSLHSATWPLELFALQAGACTSDASGRSASVCADDAAVPTQSPTAYTWRHDPNAAKDAIFLACLLACCAVPCGVLAARGLCPGPLRRLSDKCPWRRLGLGLSPSPTSGLDQGRGLSAQQRGRRRNAQAVQAHLRSARRRELDPSAPEFRDEVREEARIERLLNNEAKGWASCLLYKCSGGERERGGVPFTESDLVGVNVRFRQCGSERCGSKGGLRARKLSDTNTSRRAKLPL
jgi:hypothetical protein